MLGKRTGETGQGRKGGAIQYNAYIFNRRLFICLKKSLRIQDIGIIHETLKILTGQGFNGLSWMEGVHRCRLVFKGHSGSFRSHTAVY